MLLVLNNIKSVLDRAGKHRKSSIKPVISDRNRYSILLGILASVIIFYKFHNLVPTLIAGLIFYLVPNQILYLRERRMKQKILTQLAVAIRVFVSEYAISNNIPKSFEVAYKSSQNPIRKHLRNTYSELYFGKDKNEVLDKLGRNLNLSYGFLFTELVKTAYKQGAPIIPLFYDLVSRVTSAQEHMNYRNSEVSTENLFNLAIVLLPIPGYLFLRIIIPEIDLFIFQTQAGLVLSTVWLFSIVLWFYIDRLINDI